MKIQEIKNNNIYFQRFRKQSPSTQTIDCEVKQYCENDEKMIGINFKKNDVLGFLLGFIPRPHGNKNKNKAINCKLQISLPQETMPEAITAEETDSKPKLPPFPSPKFTSNPTPQQRDEYINEILKFLDSNIDTESKLKGLEEIKKYGISDIDLINFCLDDNSEEVIRKTLSIYQKYGTDKNPYQIIGLIRKDNIQITQEETFIELLKTMQKLAQLKNDTFEEREIILKPIRKLLSHENENIRRMAQETLDKI